MIRGKEKDEGDKERDEAIVTRRTQWTPMRRDPLRSFSCGRHTRNREACRLNYSPCGGADMRETNAWNLASRFAWMALYFVT